MKKRARYAAKRWIEQHATHDGLDCLIWPFKDDGSGRGAISVGKVRMTAPRYMCLIAHGEPPTKEHQAAHSCGNGHLGCMNQAHLSWKTPLENQADRKLHGTHMEGVSHPLAKMTAETVLQILALKGVMRQKDIAALFGVDKGTVSNIMTGRQWASVTGVEHGKRTRH